MGSGLTIKTIIISAIGGQGGNLLAEWIFHAATATGYRAQSMGMPGLAQRGGATTYYLELAIADDPALVERAVFSTFPFPGEVDVLLSQEYLEMGRMLQRGFGAPDRTTVVASMHRDYTVFEKMAIGGGVVDNADLEKLAREFSEQFIGIDMPRIVREKALNELSGNAVLLGALAASGALPISTEQFANAIRHVGVAPDANLKAFETGIAAARSHGDLAVVSQPDKIDPVGARAERLHPSQQAGYRHLATPLIELYGAGLGETLVEATYQLTDFQDAAYAREFLTEIEAMVKLDQTPPAGSAPFKLTQTYARNLATLMSYEDAVRVAEFKTRQGRFERIKQQLGVKPDQPYKVVDFLKPDMEEVYGIFPSWLVDPLLKVLGRFEHDAEGNPRYWPQTPNTTTFLGYLNVVFLTWFKPVRRSSWRYRKESAFWLEYKQLVRDFIPIDYELACLVATTGQVVRGYGNVRRRTFETVRRFINHVIRPVMSLPGEAEQGYRLTRRVGEVAKKIILADDNGIDLAETLAQRVAERHSSMAYETLIVEVEKSGNVLKQTVPVSMRRVAL